jgi:bifunctional DNA-binding transcriptional regulator/antitoxin component of YhaV-PrlF toxin-antitoxin module
MSGSGGGHWGGEPSDDCTKLAQFTTLNSPSREVLRGLRRGDLLEVAVRREGGAIIVVALRDDRVAGTITSSIIQRIAECMEEGFQYVAEVTEDVTGGVCKVHVHVK